MGLKSYSYVLRGLLLGSLLIGGFSGCYRKGIILRGDWALELNRIPHLASRNENDYSCPDGPDCQICRAKGEQGPAGPNAETPGVPTPAGVPFPDGGEVVPIPGMNPPPTLTPAVTQGQTMVTPYPKFHPVPTHPIFSPPKKEELDIELIPVLPSKPTVEIPPSGQESPEEGTEPNPMPMEEKVPPAPPLPDVESPPAPVGSSSRMKSQLNPPVSQEQTAQLLRFNEGKEIVIVSNSDAPAKGAAAGGGSSSRRMNSASPSGPSAKTASPVKSANQMKKASYSSQNNTGWIFSPAGARRFSPPSVPRTQTSRSRR